MKRIVITSLIIVFITALGIFTLQTFPKQKSEKITIRIGYQSQCTQTWSALIIKNQKLIEKNLQNEFPDHDIEVIWEDSPSGPPITNNMIAGKTQIGFMGDMPLLINGSKGQSHPTYKSILLAMDGKGKGGTNQSIMVPLADEGMSIQDLKGKTVSVPIGSSAHRMLLSILEKNSMTGDIEIVNQDVSTGLISIETQKIDAHATWEPYPAYMIHRGKSATLVDGELSGVDYLNGIVVDQKWAEENPKIAVAVAQSLLQAHTFISENPDEAARIFTEESSFPIGVTQKLVSSVRWDAFVYPQDIETLKSDVTFLKSLGKIENMDVEAFVDSSYLKQAAEKEGISYPDEEMLAQGWQEGD